MPPNALDAVMKEFWDYMMNHIYDNDADAKLRKMFQRYGDDRAREAYATAEGCGDCMHRYEEES